MWHDTWKSEGDVTQEDLGNQFHISNETERDVLLDRSYCLWGFEVWYGCVCNNLLNFNGAAAILEVMVLNGKFSMNGN
jgi:hypothetical protein